MPILKHVLIHNSVNQRLEYILNDDKTEKGALTASLNCMTNAQDAFLEMKMIYEHYTGRNYNEPIPEQGNAHVKAIHYIQSFSPDDNVTPELAHKIAKVFMRKAFGDNVQAVMATHTDKAHLHSHIIINSVDIEGNHFYANKNSLRKLRSISDEVAKAFGIFPNKNLNGTGHSIEYNEWGHKKNGTSWKEQIRNEIDSLIGVVGNLDELLSMLEDRGYEIKRGKYISVKAPRQQRFIRTKTLGEEYTEDSLKIHILYREVGAESSLTDNSRSALRAAYAAIIGDVRILAEQNKKVQRKQDTMLPYSADNDLDIYKLSAQLSVINQDKIGSIGDLEGRISKLKAQYEKEREETNHYIEQHNNMVSLLEQAQMLNSYPVSEWHGGKVHMITDSIIHLMRGQIFIIEGKSFFTMGGAESHDKAGRILGQSVWNEELPSDKEYTEALRNLRKQGFQVDYIITHCATTAVQNEVIKLTRNNTYTSNQLVKFLDELEKMLTYKKWFCGHYHLDMISEADPRTQIMFNRIVEI